jgi:hypothetical protein
MPSGVRASPPLDDAQSDRPSLWTPLRVPLFRSLFIADLLSDIGTFMQGVGAAWRG